MPGLIPSSGRRSCLCSPLGALLALPAALEAKIVPAVETNFSVQPGGNLKAVTSGGGIRVNLTEPLRENATFSTSGGNVRADGFNLEENKGGVGKNNRVAKVNNGGPRLRLCTSGGSISVTAD